MLIWLAVIGVGLWFWASLAGEGMAYEWQWNRLWVHVGKSGLNGFEAGPLLKGIYLTLGIAVWGGAFSLAFGLGAAIFRLGPWPVGNALALAYISVWRNTPLLLQLFFAYFVISPVIHTSPFWTAVLTLGAFEGAYVGEILRAGVLSVPKGQWEAALSLGLGLRHAFMSVILPQAAANTWPVLTNQAIAILKETSLVSAIAVADLTMQSQAIVAETFLAFEVWLFAGGCYLLLAGCISLPSAWLERRKKWR